MPRAFFCPRSRIILWQLREASCERGGASVPTAMLYGRVVEHIDVSVEEFQATLRRLGR